MANGLPLSRFRIGVAGLPLLLLAHDQEDLPIRTSVRFVQVSVIVHRKHMPVPDLTKDDFVLLDRGKPQKISAFSVESKRATPTRRESLPANTFSNRSNSESPSRSAISVVLLDGLNTRFEDQANAKRRLIRFLKTLSSRDRIAVYTLGKSLRVLSDFDDPQGLRKTLAAFAGSAASDIDSTEPDPSNTGNPAFDAFLDEANGKMADSTNESRAGTTFHALGAIANHLAKLPGRKNLIWVTGSLPISMRSAARALNHANIAVYAVDARGLVGLPARLTAVRPGAEPIRGRPASINFGPPGLDTMAELAELTGGRAFFNTNDLEGALRTALDDSEVSYTLGFSPPESAMDGKFHDLKVAVNRPGLEVRHRRTYFAAKDGQATPADTQATLASALLSPLESSVVPLTVRVTSADPPGPASWKISWSIDVSSLQLKQRNRTWSGAIHLVVVQQDKEGKLLDTWQDGIDLNLTEANYAAYLKSPMVITEPVRRHPAVGTLKVLVIDTSNAAVGSVIISASELQ